MRRGYNATENKQEQPRHYRGGFRLRKQLPKFSLLLIALVMGVSSVVTVFTPQSTSAVATSESKKADPDWQIRSLILYRALGQCIANWHFKQNVWSGQIDQSEVKAGNWFDNQYGSSVKPTLGPYFRGETSDNDDADVHGSCDKAGDIVNPAMTLWGFDREDFFCSIGGVRITGREGKDCLASTGASGNFSYLGNLSVDKYRKYVQKTVYGDEGTEPALSKDAYWYTFYLKVFKKSCAWKRSAQTTQGSLDILSDSTTGYKIKVAKEDGTSNTFEYYSGGLERTHDIATRPTGIEQGTGVSTVNAHCGNGGSIQIEERINHYAPLAAALIENGEMPLSQPGSDSNEEISTADNTSSCSIEGGVGWWLCPIANFIAGLTDSIFDAVTAFLRVSPVNLSPTDNPLYTAWATMRTIANVAFVIVFLIIIFSQLSSLGITNYGVKKMLPRLVVAAILVNVSYYLCAIAIDISNIVGVSLQDALNYISQQTPGTKFAADDSWQTLITNVVGGTVGIFAAGAFAGIASAGPVALLAGIIPLLFGALFALVVAFLVLLARQALIIMAVVVAPLAFVAYLLPNTEGLFKKWRSLFVTLLALFPMMALVFGGSQLASVILRESSRATLNTSQDMIAFFLYVGSFAVQAIPLFITPVLIKLSSGVLGRFAGLINNPNRGPIDRARKWAQQKADNSANAAYARRLRGNPKNPFNWGARRRAKYEAVNESVKQQAHDAQTGYVAEATKKGGYFQRRLAGTSDVAAKERVRAGALNTDLRRREEEAKVGDAILEDMNLSGRQRTDLATYGKTRIKGADGKMTEYKATESIRKAAIIRQLATGSFGEKKEIIEASWVKKDAAGNPIIDPATGKEVGGTTAEFRQLVADGAAKSPGLSTSDPALAGQRINDMTQGNFNYKAGVIQAFGEGKYTSDALVSMHNDARDALLQVAMEEAADGRTNMLESLQKAVAGIQASKEIEGKVSGNEPALADMAAISQGLSAVNALRAGREARRSLPPDQRAAMTDAIILQKAGFAPAASSDGSEQEAPVPIPPATPTVTPSGQITPPTVTNPDEYHDGMTR